MQDDPIVIVGGGFGGVFAARRLLALGQNVVLISKNNHFTFTPLLHEVATGSLITHDVIFEYEGFFRSALFEFTAGEVTRIDPFNKTVWIGESSVAYRTLVIATGSRTNEHMVKGLENAYELKTGEDASRLKQAIVEKAESPDKSVTVNVIGGGATGCELVFEIDRLLLALKKRHPTLRSSVRLIHSGKQIGGAVNATMQCYIQKQAKRTGVELVLETRASEITARRVETTSGEYASDVTVMVAGVRPNTDAFAGDLPMDEHGHIEVDEYLRVQGLDDMFALGDIISIDGHPAPKLAQTAVLQAQIVARNIHRAIHGRPLKPYRVNIRGFLLSLGFGDGIGQIGQVIVKGVLAWYIWRTVYLFKTPGLANKLRVAFSWTIGLFQGRNLTSL